MSRGKSLALPKAQSRSWSHFTCGCRLGKYPRGIVGTKETLLYHNLLALDYSTMAKILALLVIGFACVIVNVRAQTDNRKPVVGQAFDEIVVSSDLNVRRKSKENRQGKKLLTNVPSGTTGPPAKPTENASRLVSSDGSKVSSENRERRATASNRLLDLGIAGYLLNSAK